MEHVSRAGKKRLKKYLKKVERTMRKKGAGKDEVEAVIESLKEQVVELVGEPEGKADKGTIEEILSNFDAPEAYGEQVDIIGVPQRESTHWVGQFSAVLSIAGVFLAVLVGVIATASGGDGGHMGGSFFVVCEVLAFITGLIKFKTKPGKIGMFISFVLLLILFIVISANS